MRRVVRNPLADTDPYAVPFLTGDAWYDFGFGPLCRRLLAKYGVALPTEQAQRPAAGPGARAISLPGVLAARLRRYARVNRVSMSLVVADALQDRLSRPTPDSAIEAAAEEVA